MVLADWGFLRRVMNKKGKGLPVIPDKTIEKADGTRYNGFCRNRPVF
jgi:hypothetical protein